MFDFMLVLRRICALPVIVLAGLQLEAPPVLASPATTTNVIASPINPAQFGQTLFLSSTLTSLAGPPTGTVDFYLNGAVNASPTLTTHFVSAASAGRTSSCAIDNVGKAWCWGKNDLGQLGNGTLGDSLVPVQVSSGSIFTRISVGFDHACGLTSLGGVKCWGSNNTGQLGDGSLINRKAPIDVVGLTSGVVDVQSGDFHSCAITTAGALKCWGTNADGELGNNSLVGSAAPVTVTGYSSNTVSVAAGGTSTCAINQSGKLQCWGDNVFGQLGNNSNTDAKVPVDVTGFATATSAVAVGSTSACALNTSGGVKCWGLNNKGQLGDATQVSSLTQVQVLNMASGAVSIDVGRNHACAALFTGVIKCWGENASGQLGDGTKVAKSSPTAVSLAAIPAKVSVGSDSSCALNSNGALACWGYDSWGNLGDNDIINKTAPVAPKNLVRSVATYIFPASVPGSYPVQAVYNGTPTFGGSASIAINQVITKANSATAEDISPLVAVYGQPVDFEFSVTSNNTVPAGNVLVQDNGNPDGTFPLVSGLVSFSRADLDVGNHVYAASYPGSATHLSSSVPAALAVTVTKAGSTTSLDLSATSILPLQSVTLVADVAVTAPGGGPAIGTVEFYDGGQMLGDNATLLGSAPVAAGKASLTVSGLGAGNHLLFASYGGSVIWKTSISSDVSLSVDAAVGKVTVVNKVTAGNQFGAVATALPGGRLLALWLSDKQDGSGLGIISQMFAKSGKPTGGQKIVNTIRPGNQIAPAVALLKSGQSVIVWQNASGDIAGQRFAATGGKIGGEFAINSHVALLQSAPAITALDNGGFVVGWTSQLVTPKVTGILLQRFSALGARLGPEIRADRSKKGAVVSHATLSALAGGGYAVAWVEKPTPKLAARILAHAFSKKGVAAKSILVVGTDKTHAKASPVLTRLAGGEILAVWTSSGQDGSGLGVYGQRYNAGLTKRVGTEFRVNTATAGDQGEPAVTAFPGGGAIVAWSTANGPGKAKTIACQGFDKAGKSIGAGTDLATTPITSAKQSAPAIAATSDRSFTLFWTTADKSGTGIVNQRFALAGPVGGS